MDAASLDRRFQFIGYGPATARLWFVGIEEGGEDVEVVVDGLVDHWIGDRRVRHHPERPEPAGQKVWETACDLAKAVEPRDEYFLSNIAPVPRRSIKEKLPDNIDPKQYRDRVFKQRVALFVARHPYGTKNVTVFHGKAGWRSYGVLNKFDLKEAESRDAETGLVICDEEKHIIFAPTFSWGERHFPEAQRNAVKGLLQKWLK
jgi:hypothetical protein